jgi:hypothetical protein
VTLPPLVERELRVAARLRSTSRLRVVAALIAAVLGGGLILLTLAGLPLFLGTSIGRGLFATLTWLALAAALLSGPFLTSDALSIEKREGTLGFLFLTDLRGYDVVLGKLMASALRAGYGLLAILPVLALTLTMGGITGAQFWKTALALGTALMLSLSAGLFCSSLCREAQKALGLTVLLLALITATGPITDSLLSAAIGWSSGPVFSLCSPGYLFAAAGAWGRSSFWSAWMVNLLLIGALLLSTCIRLPRTWQETGEGTSRYGRFWNRPWSRGGEAGRASERRRLLDLNPVLWVVSRELWLLRGSWLAVLVSAAGLIGYCLADDDVPGLFMTIITEVWTSLSFIIPLLAYLAVASQSCRFLGDARRSGLLELLLSTPLTHADLVRGYWRGLLRNLGLPLALLILIDVIGEQVSSQRTQLQITATMAAPPASGSNTVMAGSVTSVGMTNSAPASPNAGPAGPVNPVPPGTPLSGLLSAPPVWVQWMVSLLLGANLAANLAAIAWAGLWMGLINRSVNIATLKTLLFVQIIPFFAFSFLSALVFPLVLVPMLLGGSSPPSANAMQTLAVWMPMLFGAVYGLLNLAKDLGFVLWAKERLSVEFRAQASLSFSPAIVPAPPILESSPGEGSAKVQNSGSTE